MRIDDSHADDLAVAGKSSWNIREPLRLSCRRQ